MKHLYTIELSLTKYHIEADSSPWRGADALATFGNSFEELINNAEIFFQDQDGGEAGSCPFDGSYMSNKIYNDIYLEIARIYYVQMVEVMQAQGWTHIAPRDVVLKRKEY